MDATERFGRVVRALAKQPDVSTVRMFGSTGLKAGSKTFAMLVRGRLVVKLPRERVGELVEAADCEHFDPGHGRLMREWVAVPPGTGWTALAREAYTFVRGR